MYAGRKYIHMSSENVYVSLLSLRTFVLSDGGGGKVKKSIVLLFPFPPCFYFIRKQNLKKTHSHILPYIKC